MGAGGLGSPVVLDGIVSDEKVSELLGLHAEYPELDYKATIEPTTTRGRLELAKDIGAMQVRGGYLIGGVNNDGVPTGRLDDVDLRPFDEANLTPKLLRYLPEPLELRTRVTRRDGHVILVIYVGAHPAGCAFFRADGTYTEGGKEVVVFRRGDAFWRDGTRSVPLTQQGLEGVIERRIARAKTLWLDELQSLRRHERADPDAAGAAFAANAAPIAALTFDLSNRALVDATLELLRRDDTIALQHLLGGAGGRARTLLRLADFEAELADLLDKLACVAATFVEHEQHEWLDRTIAILAEMYSSPLGQGDALRFGHSPRIDSAEKAPRVWLLVIERVYGLGALAVRRRNWKALRALTLQKPEGLTDYDTNWLRHALTMAACAQHLQEPRNDGNDVDISLLSIARNDIARLACLRPDGLDPDDDAIISSLAQFDVLANLVAIDGSADADDRVFYTNFARFRQARIQPAVERLLTDDDMRRILFTRGDSDLAVALTAVGQLAYREGLRFDGFEGWAQTPVGTFIAEHLPGDA